MPAAAPATETAAEQMVTALKLLNSRMADSAGKMIRAENEQRAHQVHGQHDDDRDDHRDEQAVPPAGRPVAVAKASSKVTAKMRL